MVLAYADDGGEVGPFDDWWPAVSGDAEYDPALCFVAEDEEGGMAGFVQCWTSAFVKDLVVHPAWRRRGLGKALLLTAFDAFRERGARAVDLKVRADNPSDAPAFYRALGMQAVG